MQIAERQGVEIDYCPECRGIWLDRGELDKIIDRVVDSDSEYQSKRPDVSPPQPSYAPPRRDDNYRHSDDYRRNDDYRHSDEYKKKRKKNWLGEMFDFD